MAAQEETDPSGKHILISASLHTSPSVRTAGKKNGVGKDSAVKWAETEARAVYPYLHLNFTESPWCVYLVKLFFQLVAGQFPAVKRCSELSFPRVSHPGAPWWFLVDQKAQISPSQKIWASLRMSRNPGQDMANGGQCNDCVPLPQRELMGLNHCGKSTQVHGQWRCPRAGQGEPEQRTGGAGGLQQIFTDKQQGKAAA